MARKRIISAVPDLDPHRVANSVREYLQNRSMRERSEYHEGTIKKELMALLDLAGEVIDKNKKVIALDPLPYVHYKNGKPIEKTIVGIERRVRRGQVMDEDKTLALLRKKGLLEACTIPTIVIDEDSVLAANYDGKITDDELKAIYTPTEVAAFYLTEE